MVRGKDDRRLPINMWTAIPTDRANGILLVEHGTSAKCTHFTTVGKASRNVAMTGLLRAGSLEQLGMFLHAEQDSWSHCGYWPRSTVNRSSGSPRSVMGELGRADAMDRWSARYVAGLQRRSTTFDRISRNLRASSVQRCKPQTS